jgi:hypothetical protein
LEQVGITSPINNYSYTVKAPIGAVIPSVTGNASKYTETTVPKNIIERHKWSHDLYNTRNMSAFAEIFAPTALYKDHATRKYYYSGQDVINSVERIWSFSGDAHITNREYFVSTSPNGLTTFSRFNVIGINDKEVLGYPATGKPFNIPVMEVILLELGRIDYERRHLLPPYVDEPARNHIHTGLLKPIRRHFGI